MKTRTGSPPAPRRLSTTLAAAFFSSSAVALLLYVCVETLFDFNIRESIGIGVGIALVLAGLATIFGFYMARKLAAPVIDLTVTASRIAAGERDLQAPVSGPREVAHLAVAFNSMTARLRQSLKDLEQHLADLKPTEEALRLSEERIRLALDGTSDGIWDWNLQTGHVYFSPRYYTMMGYDPEEFPPSYESWRQRLHPDDAEAAEQVLRHSVGKRLPFAIEYRFKTKNGEWRWILGRGKVVEWDKEGNAARVAGSHTDITDHKRAEEALEKRITALTQPLDAAEEIAFEDLFSLSEIQRLQDLYAEAFGLAALITRPDGTPITQPSNFSELCGEIIRKNPKGVKNCNRSDAMIGQHNPFGPIIQPCLSAGLCNAGASITVGGHHVANWLIGQVRNETQTEEEIMPYAREIGADETAFRAAYRKVPVMSQEQFERLAHVLFELANQISTTAYQNVQQARFIAERKRAEEALRQATLVVENSPVMFFRWKAEEGWPVALVSQNVTQIGYTPEELLNGSVSFEAIVHPDDLERIGREVRTYSASGADRFQQEYRIVTKDGQVRWVDDRTAVEKDSEGRITHFQGIVVDVTERKQAEEALRNYERIVSTSRDLMALINRDFVYEAVNESYLDYHGRAREETLGRTVWELMGKSACEKQVRPKLEQVFSGQAVNFQTYFDFAGYGRRYMDVSYVPLFDEKGKVKGVVVNSRDITETRKLEEQLMHSQKIESLGTLAGGVAHEINNPINGIMNYAQLIMDRLEEEKPGERVCRGNYPRDPACLHHRPKPAHLCEA